MKKVKKTIWILFAVVLAAAAFPLSVSADSGPKPSITIVIENPPEEEYYLDLLVDGNAHYENYYGHELNEDMVQVLREYEEDGWHPALAGGTSAPLIGQLVGEERDGKMYHGFSYAVPDEYKVIIVTSDLGIRVSELHRREVFSETVYIDFATADYLDVEDTTDYEQLERAAREADLVLRPENLALTYAAQLAYTLSMTLLIELVVLLLFRFSLRRNWKVFLLVNIATQIFMTVVLGVLMMGFGQNVALFAFLPVELVIIAAEALAYSRWLQGHSTRRRVVYAVVSNVASIVGGFLMILLALAVSIF